MASRRAAWRGVVPGTGAVAGVAAAVRADTIYVPRDQPTIQTAVDAAQSGDVIVVVAGAYHENVVLSGSSHDGVQMYSDGDVVIEGRGTAPAITVTDVFDVGVHGFTVHSGGDGVLVAKASAIVVDGLTAADCAGAGIRVETSVDVTLQADDVSGTGGSGAAITNSGAVTVEGNTFHDVAADGVTVTGGSSVSLCSNTITACGGSGIAATDVQQLVIDETNVDDVAGNAVDAAHCDVVSILNNSFGGGDPATTIGGDAVHVDSATQLTVESNVLMGAEGAGVSVTGAGGNIQSNTILDVGGTAVAITGSAYSYVGANHIEHPGGSGVVVDGESNTVDANYISFTGVDGIAVHGANNEVGGNTVYRPASDGVCVTNAADDAGVTVRDNVVTRPGADGLNLGATCHSAITDNTVTRAHANGVELTTGADNVLGGNRASRSRGFDLFEGADPASNDVAPTNHFKKMNKRGHHGHRK